MIFPDDTFNDDEREYFCQSAERAYEARIQLLRDFNIVNSTTIALPCSRAETLSYLDEVERYFKNT